MKTRLMRTTALLTGLLASATATAHTGDHGGGLVAGLVHPLSGLDHMLVLMVLGLWACRDAGSLGNLRPAGFFLGAVLAGAALATAGVSLPATESMIAVSVVLGGLVLARQVRLDLLGAASFGVFGLFHGQAHMAGSQAEPLLFVLGLTSVSIAVIAAFRWVGLESREPLRRVAGYATAAAGALLLLGA